MSKSNINQHHPYAEKLRSWRTPIFNFSLLCALGIVTYAFNWTSYNQPPQKVEHEEIEMEPEVQIVRTNHEQKRVPPPPVIKPSTEVIPDDVVYEPEPEPVLVDDKVVINDIEPMAPVVEPARPIVIPKAATLPPAKETEPDGIFMVVEEMPRFNGCEDILDNKAERYNCSTKKMLEYVYHHIKYPPVARDNNIQGMVVIQFTIEKDGSITDVKVIKEIGAGCGQQAANVVKSMPDWIPGKQRGKEVRVRYNLPVKYRLD